MTEVSQSKSTVSISRAGNGLEPEVGTVKGKDPRPHSQVWAIAIAAGVVAGLVAGVAGEFFHKTFKAQVFSVRNTFSTDIQVTTDSQNAADVKNATLVFAILGGVIGAAMGIAGGLAGRSLARGLIVAFGGLLAGGLVGTVGSRGLLPLFFRKLVPNPNDLLEPVLIHSGIWMAIGVVGGLAFAIGMGRARYAFNAVTGACFGAFLAALLFHGLGEALFPDSGSTAPLATTTLVRFQAAVLTTILIACGAARGALGRASRPASGAN